MTGATYFDNVEVGLDQYLDDFCLQSLFIRWNVGASNLVGDLRQSDGLSSFSVVLAIVANAMALTSVEDSHVTGIGVWNSGSTSWDGACLGVCSRGFQSMLVRLLSSGDGCLTANEVGMRSVDVG